MCVMPPTQPLFLCNPSTSTLPLGEGSSAVTSEIPDHTSADTQLFYPTLSSQHPVVEEGEDDEACQDTRDLGQQQLRDEGDSLQLYENENAEKERQYEQHKAMLLQHRHALHGYKYGVLGMPITRYAAFTCNKCRKGFGRRKAYEKHLKTHMPLNQCRYCSFKTRNKKQFEIHELRHLKGNPQFECDQCQMKYATSALLRGHRGRHHNIFHCYYCPEVYNSFEGRKKHMLEVHGVNIKRKKVRYDQGTEEADEDQADDKAGADPAEVAEHVCDMCSKPCRSRALLRIHVAQHLQVDPSQLSENLEPIEGTVAPDDITTEDSEDAKVEYTPPRVYRKRLHNVLDEKQQPPAKVSRLDNDACSYERYINDPDINLLARLKPASENAMFYCANCDVSFASPHVLLFHVVTVHGFVEYDARRRASGKAMVKDAHEEDESKLPVDTPHVQAEANTLADYYGDLFTSDYGVTASENPPLESTFVPYRFTCDKCDPPASFRKSKQLKKHMKVHCTTRKCCACNFSSKKMFLILRHQGACHKKMLRCPYLCLQLFATREDLQNHKREVHFGKPSAAAAASVEEDDDDDEEEEEEEERHDSTD